MNPMSSEQLLEVIPDPEYRLPPRSLLRDFSRIQFALKNGGTDLLMQTRCLSDDEILFPAFTTIHRRDLLYVEEEHPLPYNQVG